MFLPLGLAGQQMTDFWRPIEGPPHDQATYFTISVDQQDQLYVGTDKCVVLTSNLGVSWTTLLTSDIPIVKLLLSGTKIFAIAIDKTILISSDKGINWQSTSFTQESEITDLTLLADGSLLIATGHIEVKNDVGLFPGRGLYKSPDEGITWEKVSMGLDKDH